MELMNSPYLLAFATAFGLALVHSFWIGALLFTTVRALLPFLPGPTARYKLAYCALLLLGGTFVATYAMVYDPKPVCENLLVTGTSLPMISLPAATPETGWIDWLTGQLPAFAPWLSMLYVLGFLPALIRLIAGQYTVHQLGSRGLSGLPTGWADRLGDELSRHPATCRVRCFLSQHAGEVMTLGFWSPVIVFPVALVNTLTPEMARTILLHEIAHLRHYDHWLNYPQQVLKTFFFYHPAAYALCRIIDREREHRCDDWVAQRCEDRRTYATALVAVARTSHNPQIPLAMSATKTPFSNRIQRLFLGEKRSKDGQVTFSILLLALLTSLHFGFTGADVVTELAERTGAVDCLEEQGTADDSPARPVEASLDLAPMLIDTPPPSASHNRITHKEDGSLLLNGNTLISADKIDIAPLNDGEPKPLMFLDGKQVQPGIMETIAPDDIQSINVLKGPAAIAKLGPAGKNGIVYIVTKAQADDNLTSTNLMGSDVRIEFTKPGEVNLEGTVEAEDLKETVQDVVRFGKLNSVPSEGVAPAPIKADDPDSWNIPATGGSDYAKINEERELNGFARMEEVDQRKFALFTDGKRVPGIIYGMPLIETEDKIERIKIVDGEELEALGLGDLDGAIYLTTKSGAKPVAEEPAPKPANIKVRGLEDQNVAYFVNDVRIQPSPLNDINPSNIEHITVVEDKAQLRQAGIANYEGAIYIVTKDGLPAAAPKPAPATITRLDFEDEQLNAVYLVNGKRMSYRKVKKIAMEDVENIDVRKGADKAAEMGYPNHDGVVVITLKR